jgi:serine phosphatase RsbU (regulator of sigma subunit)
MVYGSRRGDRDRGGYGNQGRRGDRRDPRREQARRTTGYGGRPVPRRIVRQLPPEVDAAIATDPAFQVVTLDRQTWIDPYSGQAVPAPEGHQKAAHAFLLDNSTWREGRLLPIDHLQAIAWRYDLLRLLPNEPRLRIFGRDGQGWLNPYNGEYVQSVSREEGRVTMKTVTAMSQALVRCPQARQGVMLDAETLQKRARQVSSSGQHASTTHAGEAASHSTVFGLSGLPGMGGMSDDLKKAQDVQANMLADLPKIDGWEICVHFTPHSGVSGDFYEVMPLPGGRFLLVLGDVSGHGMQAALVVATALKTLRLLAKRTHHLVELMGQFNDEIKDDLLPGQFITCFAGILDPADSSLNCVLAGHHPLVVINPNKNAVISKSGRSGMAIGLLSGSLFRQSLKEERVAIEPGDALVQFTDGLVEAADKQEREFGAHRLYAAFLNRYEEGAQEMIDGAVADVVAFAGGNPDDDLTLLAILRLPPPEEEEAAASG